MISSLNFGYYSKNLKVTNLIIDFTTPTLKLKLAFKINSLAHYAKGTLLLYKKASTVKYIEF